MFVHVCTNKPDLMYSIHSCTYIRMCCTYVHVVVDLWYYVYNKFAGLYIHVYKIYRPDLMHIYHAHAYVQYIHNSSGSLVLQVSLQVYTYV